MSSSPHQHRIWPIAWPFALLAIAGCSFGGDHKPNKNESKGDVADSPDGEGDCDGLSELGGLACPREPDSGACTGAACDAGTPDCIGEGCPLLAGTCESDAECESEEYCSIPKRRNAYEPRGKCEPRCDANGVCAGPVYSVDAQLNGLVGDDSGVCFSTSPMVTYRNSPEIWAWDMSGASTRLVSILASLKVLFSTAGYCYFEYITGQAISRVPIEGEGATVHGLTATNSYVFPDGGRSWLTPTHVWWSFRPSRSGAAELWRVAREHLAMPEKFAENLEYVWEAGNSTHVLRAVPGTGELMMASLTDLTAETRIRTSATTSRYQQLLVDGDDLIFRLESKIARVKLSSPDAPETVYSWDGSFPFQVQDGFVYWSEGTRVYRSPKDDPSQKEQVFGFSQTGDPQPYFAIVGDRIVYNHSDQQRLFVAPIASRSAN